jgi:GNAT superfamily N-acetyltransferase
MTAHGEVPDVELREGTIDDVPLLLSFVRAMAGFEGLEVTATEASLRSALFGPEPAARVLLAYVGGHPVGYATYFFTFASTLGARNLWLDDLFVTESFRRRGVGQAIMRYLSALAVKYRCSRLEWMVLDWNTSAIAFYERLGAVIHPKWRIARIDEIQLRALAGRTDPGPDGGTGSVQ